MLRFFARVFGWLLSIMLVLASFITPAAPFSLRAAPADEPVPVVLDNVEEWSVGAGLVYWAENCVGDEFGTTAFLKRKPIAGGTERTIMDASASGFCITFLNMFSDDAGVYFLQHFSNQVQGRINLIPPASNLTQVDVKVLDSTEFPIGRPFAETDGYLYWATSSMNKIFRVRKDGSGKLNELETVADTAASPSDVIAVGSTIYWTDNEGVWSIGTACDTLPCVDTRQQFDDFGSNPKGFNLVYQPLGGRFGNYRIYWVQRFGNPPNEVNRIVYRGCDALTICFVLPPQGSGQAAEPPITFYTATPNWWVGHPILANNNLYWTEGEQGNTNVGDVRRRPYDAAPADSTDSIATNQAMLDGRLFVANDTLFFARRGNGIYSLPLNASAILRALSIDGIEVTQGIQNLANDVPLVASKATYVRAYGKQLSGPNTPNVEAQLVGTRNGNPLPGSPLKPLNGVRALTSGGGYDRARLEDGWYFLLPANWTEVGSISLKVLIDPRHMHSDPNPDDNELNRQISFQNQPPVCVWTVPVRTHTPLPSTNDPNFWGMVSQFERRWPVPQAWIFRDTDPVEELEVCWYGPAPYPCHGPYELEDGWGLTNGIPDRDKVIASLWGRALLSFNPDSCDDIDAPVHFMGIVHPDANNGGASGYASTVSKQSWVQLPGHFPNPIASVWSAMREGSTMAQELAHNHGRKHVDCGGPDDLDGGYPYSPCQIANTGPDSYYGFDIATLQPIRPDQTADFMSYSRRSWVSDYTWRALLGKFAVTEGAGVRPDDMSAGENVFVTGLVDRDNKRGEISLVLVLPAESLPPTTRLRLHAQGEGTQHGDAPHVAYKLRLLNPTGDVLVERTLALTPLDDHSAESNAALFSDLFPQPAGQVAEIQLLADNSVIVTRTPGIQLPTVSIQQPAGGAQIDDELAIRWTAGDPDPDDRLLFTVQYSHDDGASWHTLAINVPGTPDPVNNLLLSELGSLHGSAPNAARIRVLASDGYNTTIVTSQPFTLQNRPPEPAIISPAAGQSFVAGQAVLLSGSAIDAEDGGLTGDSLQWQVDGIGNGSGSDVAADGLAPGSHTATLAATDANNQTTTTSVSFAVARLTLRHAPAPMLDGFCEDASYAEGASLLLKPYGDGTQANASVLRSDDYLWVCFSGLQKGALDPGAYVGVRVDIDNSRDAQAQSSDAGFFAGENGDVFTTTGDGAGGFVTPGPGGLQAQVSAGESSWSAELRIDKATLNGWDHLVRLSFGHHAVAMQGDDYLWPYRSEWSKPGTWAATALGSQPVIMALDPFTATVQGPSFTLMIEGSGFVSGTGALWNGSNLPTTYMDGEHLTAQVAADKLVDASIVQVTTRSPSPGNFESNAVAFVVEAAPPVITNLSPGSVVAGSPTMNLQVDGNNFAPDAQVLWDGTALATTFISPTRVRAQMTAALLANGKTVGVAVRNPSPDGHTSAVIFFDVQAVTSQIVDQQIYLPVIVK